jgi:membrane protein
MDKAGGPTRKWSLKHTLELVRQFVDEEIWELELARLPHLKRFCCSVFRIGRIVVKGLVADKCALQASALSYTTLISMVPVLAIVFSVAKGFGAQEMLMKVVQGYLEELPTQAAEFVGQVFGYVDNTNVGTLGTVGLGLIFWTVIKVLGKVENTFNTIWGVHQPRSWNRKFTDYISVLVVVPILMLMGTGITTVLSSGPIVVYLKQYAGPLYLLYQQLIGLTGFGMLIVAFAFLYAFMPNAEVRIVSALAGGVFGGGLWFLMQRVYIVAQVGVARTNAIYGTFAAIPFFLAWLYVSWLIVLLGAEISFAVQYYRTYWQESASSEATHSTRELLGLLVCYQVCQAFLKGKAAWSVREFARQNDVPVRLAVAVVQVLLDHEVLLAVDEQKSRMVPARDLGALTPADVVAAFHGAEAPFARKLTRNLASPAYKLFLEQYGDFDRRLQTLSFRELLNEPRPGRAVQA